MATSGSGAYPTPGSQASSAPPTAYPTGVGSPPAFSKFVVIHIATTCDEHGVYVTKDSAEVIEIGWVVVDAQNPEREVRAFSVSGGISFVERSTSRTRLLIQFLCSCTASQCSFGP